MGYARGDARVMGCAVGYAKGYAKGHVTDDSSEHMNDRGQEEDRR